MLISSRAIQLSVIALGMIVSSLDSMVNFAFPAIIQDFDLSNPTIRWVAVCFLLSFGGALLICGKLGDLYGYRAVFKAGVAVSAIALLACSVAPYFGWHWLLGARVLQGIGAALVMSCTVALTTSLFPESERQTAIDLRVVIFSAVSAAGPLFGGLFVELNNWAGIFWSRGVVLALLWIALQAEPRLLPATHQSNERDKFDVWGALLLTACVSTFLLAGAIALQESISGGGALAAALAVLGVAAAIVYAGHARRHPQPFLRPSLFAEPRFPFLNLLSIAVHALSFAPILWVPFYVKAAGIPFPWSGAMVALSPAGMALAGFVLSRVAGHGLLSDGLRQKMVPVGGVVLMIVSTIVVAAVADWPSLWIFCIGLLCQGIGLGMFNATYTGIVAAAMPPQDRGIAGGIVELTRTFGLATGATLLSVSLPPAAAPALAHVLAGLEAAFLIGAAAMSVMLLVWIAFPGLMKR